MKCICPKELSNTSINKKGLDLIKPHDGSTKIIFHQKDTIEPVSVNEKCEYKVVETPKGLNTVGIKKLDSENASD